MIYLAKLLCFSMMTLGGAFTLAPRAAGVPRTAVAATSCELSAFAMTPRAALIMADAAVAEKEAEEKEETEEEKAAREAAEAEEARLKAEEEAKKKAAAAAKKKAEEEAKAKKLAEEIAEVKACFADKALVLTETAMMNPPPATTQERIDYLTNKGIPEKSIKAAMTEIGVEQIEYQRDPWGRIVARNDIKSHPNVYPPKYDAFGQLRPRE